jgi:uncharacterized protein YggT (Ycf19 family)
MTRTAQYLLVVQIVHSWVEHSNSTAFVDFILNLAAVLLWFNWRSLRIEFSNRAAAGTLAGTLKRAAPHSLRPWYFLAGLLALLMLRALVYEYIGAPAGWRARVNLGPVVLAFRSDVRPAIMVYSLLSFGRTLAIAYFWITALVILNRGAANPDPIQKLLAAQLGWVARWPLPAMVCVSFLGVAVAWLAVHPLLLGVDVVTRAPLTRLVQQSLLLNVTLCCTLKYLFPPLLLLHFISTYVYLGGSPAWEFISATAENLLAPLKPLPLRIAKLDFAPLAGVALILCLLHWAPGIIHGKLAEHHLTLWPQ